MTRVMVFGASTTYGAWDKEGGWVDRLKRFCHQKSVADGLKCLVYNLGISGKSTTDMLKRFEFETKQRLKEGEETIFIIEAGTNDSRFVHSRGEKETPPEKFRENIRKIIALAKQFSENIVFVGPRPVDEKKTDPIPWNKDHSFRNKDIKKYNEILKSVCEEEGVHFIWLFEKLSGKRFLFEDGLHPNSEGHKKIYEIVRDFLQEKKIL